MYQHFDLLHSSKPITHNSAAYLHSPFDPQGRIQRGEFGSYKEVNKSCCSSLIMEKKKKIKNVFFGALKKRKKWCIFRTKKQCRIPFAHQEKKIFLERPKETMERLLSFFTFKNQKTKNLL